MLTALLLAAGASHRMGDDNKLLQSWRGQPLIAYMVTMLNQSSLDEVIVITGSKADAVCAALPEGTRTIHNPQWPEGMTTTIATGIQAAHRDTRGYLICLADLPLLTASDVDHLVTQFKLALAKDARAIGVPIYQGQRGNPVIFSAAWRETLRAQTGQDGCKQVVRDHLQHVTLLTSPNDHILCDMDTPAARTALLLREKNLS